MIPADRSMVSLLGSGDELLHVIEREFNADIHVRGNEITATGNPAETALVADLFDELLELLRKGTDLTADAVERTAAMLRAERGVRPADVLTVGILSARGRTIRPKTLNQKRYADAIDKHTIVFAIGPAGTGKTYLAMAKAVKALQAKEVNRIILTRPAVEAGERLGFLPGTLYEKIDPYLRPLYDALHDMLDPDSIPRLMAAGTIEIAPLAYMRGRCATSCHTGAHPGRLPAHRLPGRRRYGHRVRRQAHPGDRRIPAGREGHLPAHHPGRRLDALLGRPPVGRGHPRRPPPRQAAPGPDHPRDDRPPARQPLPPVRTAAAQRARLLPLPGSPDRPLRAGPAARRRLPDRDNHAQLRHRRPGAGLRVEAAAAGYRGPARRRTQLPPEPADVAVEHHHPCGEPGDRGSAPARPARHPVVDQVRARPLPVQLAQGPAGPPAGPARHRRRPGHPAESDVPRPVHDRLAAPARRRDLPGPLAGRHRLPPHPPRRGPLLAPRQGTPRPPPSRRLHRRHPAPGRHRAVPPHPEARRRTTPRAAAGARRATSRASSPPAPPRRSASRWRRKTRSTRPRTSCSPTTP